MRGLRNSYFIIPFYPILSSLALKFYTYSVLASLIDIYIKIFSRLERDPKFSYGYMRGVSLNSY